MQARAARERFRQWNGNSSCSLGLISELPWSMDSRLRHDGFQILADGREAFPLTQHPARGIFYSDHRKMDLLPRKLLLSNLAEHED